MLRTVESLTINPLFYDALSGEFYSNKLMPQQPHRLGRLAIVCFKKGVPSEVRQSKASNEGGVIAVDYTPSWASQEVSVRTWARLGMDDIGRPSAKLFALLLSQNNEAKLSIAELISPNGTGDYDLQIASQDAEPVRMAFDLANADRIQTQVTESAQAFFDSVQ